MYAALWSILPGPWWVRVLILLILIAGVAYALMAWVFPWVLPLVTPPAEVTVQ